MPNVGEHTPGWIGRRADLKGLLVAAGVFAVLLSGSPLMSNPASANGGASYQSDVAFRDFVMVHRNASKACRDRTFRMRSASIVHFSDVSVRVGTRRQIRTGIPLSSEIFFVRYQGTSNCTVYIPN